MTRTRLATSLFLGFVIISCGASMRPIPDDVQPSPEALRAKTLADGGSIALGDAARFVELRHGEHSAPACVDSRHHALSVRQITSDRWVVSRGVMDLVRTESVGGDPKAQLSAQMDPTTGKILGLFVMDIGVSCLGAIGFREGDLIRSINDVVPSDWTVYSAVYQSIMKDGNAVVRFERGGKMNSVLYEVRND